MHELGHNFGSGHTHDDYDPKIDICHIGDNPGTNPHTPNSGTIMSYCGRSHQCGGHQCRSNVAYTFGGKYVSGPRNDVNSYINSPTLQKLGEVSVEPRRVNAKILDYLSSVRDCIKPKPTCCDSGICPGSKEDGELCTTSSQCKNECCALVSSSFFQFTFKCNSGGISCSHPQGPPPFTQSSDSCFLDGKNCLDPNCWQYNTYCAISACWKCCHGYRWINYWDSPPNGVAGFYCY